MLSSTNWVVSITFFLSFSHIPSKETLVEMIDLSDWSYFCGDKINFLEHVEVSVKLNYTRRGDLLIKLVSPQGTVSNLTHYRKQDSYYRLKNLDWVLMTLHYWGENATGPWKLRLHNSQLNHVNTGTIIRILYFGGHARLQIWKRVTLPVMCFGCVVKTSWSHSFMT